MNTIEVEGRRVAPSKVVCVGRNYVEHIEELGNELPESMVVFLKPNSAINDRLMSGPFERHYEAEICFVVGHGEFCGVGFGLDLTKRALQSQLKSKGLPWERSKAFDGAAVLGRFVSLASPEETLSLELEIDGERRQFGTTHEMIYPPALILKEIGSFMTLEEGDVVMTGTPKGVGLVSSGAAFVGRIRSEGKLLTEESWRAV